MNDYEREHAAYLRKAGAECAVLLKSDGTFPLAKPCETALYGSGARRTIKGGTGSGEVNSRYFITVEEGLEDGGFIVTTKDWLDSYEEVYQAARKDFFKEIKARAKKNHTNPVVEGMGAVMPEPEYELSMTGAGPLAVYVLSRISGEGNDRRPEAGDIKLTQTEIRDILSLQRRYERFLLVLNVGGAVDLTPVMDVKNILLLSQLGVETGHILSDIMLGISEPSGRLATTWSAWEDYPHVGDFGDINETRYKEGVYVGYRYFDSVGRRALFPFGYGLGYTEFVITPEKTSGVPATDASGTQTGSAYVSVTEGSKVSFRAEVKNAGKRPGKGVAQLYLSSPAGRLDKPAKALAAFGKTGELPVGESETLELSFDLRDMASYDEAKAAYVLEAGDYVLRLGGNSVDTEPAAVLRLPEEVVVRQVRNSLGKPDFTDWKPEKAASAVGAGTEDAAGGAADEAKVLAALPVVTLDSAAIPTETVQYDLEEEVDEKLQPLSDEELAYMNMGAFDPKAGPMAVIGSASKNVAGAAGETTGMLLDKGIPALVMADGPAGIRISRQYTRDEKGAHSIGAAFPESVMEMMPPVARFFVKKMADGSKAKGEVFEQNCTAIPIGTGIAQSWNTELAEKCGDLVGDEMERFAVHLWLAPALNIHRDLRCGRNFEYFSEDPLISGKFAAAITRGVQRHPGCGTTIKHYAANNQETNRYFANSQVSERAMREIYLKGFEIAVKESQPHALMTSYNLLNGVHTSERRGLNQDILRSEFGYQGIIMTDWVVGMAPVRGSIYKGPDPALVAASGNDLFMPGGIKDYKALMAGLAAGRVTRRQMLVNATRVYRMAKKLTEAGKNS